MHRRIGLRRFGVVLGCAGVGALAWGALGAAPSVTTLQLASTDPGCTASTPAPGVVVVCLHETQEGFTASSFGTHSCDNIDNRDPSLDYFVFVLPAAGDAGRTFTTPAPTVTFDSGTTTGTISSSNAKFFFASAAPGTVLLEAVAHADNGTGIPRGGEAQVFNLTHTCPATTTSSSSSTGTSSTSTSSTETSSTETSSTETSSTETSSTETSSTETSSTETSSTATGSVSGTSTSTSTGGVGGISTSSSSSGGAAGAVKTPTTGVGDRGQFVFVGTMLVLIGAALVFLARRRPPTTEAPVRQYRDWRY